MRKIQCPKCGKRKAESEFYENHLWCRTCVSQYHRAYYKTHREEIKERVKTNRTMRPEVIKTWYQNNREEQKARANTYYKAHSKEMNEYQKAHRAAHPEKREAWEKEYEQSHKAQRAAKCMKRTAAKLRQTLKGTDPKALEAFYIEADRCTKETGVKHSVDHIIPLLGRLVRGLHVPWNLQVMPLRDNIKKGNRI
jgi:hypothetical protein